jgi:diphthamide biosynthesis methyltransferase
LKKIRSDVKEATRDVLEGNFNFKGNVVLVVPGDPLAATTHASLAIEARKRAKAGGSSGIKVSSGPA